MKNSLPLIHDAFAAQDASLPRGKRLEAALLSLLDRAVLVEGDALPPQREVAGALGLSLGTVTKAYERLKRSGMLYGERGRGSFIAYRRQFAHDFGDRFVLDEDHLHDGVAEGEADEDACILCNVIERLEFLNPPLPARLPLGPAPGEGPDSLRETGSAYLRQLGVYLRPGDVMLSHNAYVALWTAFQVGCPPGSVLGVPTLSFMPLFQQRLVAANVRLVPLSSDDYGIVPEALENACRTQGLSVLSCSPECELPTTYRMEGKRREEIAALARKYDLKVIEHNWLLPNGQEPDQRALAMFIPERTIFLEHGSKMLACGTCCSFSYVPESLRADFIYMRNILFGPLPLLSRRLSYSWLSKGFARRDFARKNAEIVKRNALIKEVLDPLPVRMNKYARFCWVPLERGQSGNGIRKSLQRQGVLVSTAEKYLVGSACKEDGILIGLGYEASFARFEKALRIIKRELTR